MKKFLSGVLALLVVWSIIPLAGFTAFAQRSGDFEYAVLSKADKTCKITNYTGSATVLDIPAQLDGYTVTNIGDDAFWYCDSLVQVSIPSSVASIGDGAFYNCTSLTKIDVDSQNPAYFSKDGVLFNKAQTKLIRYPASKPNSSYTIPQGVTSIEYAFAYCDSLVQVTIPESVTSIGDYAFLGCSNLESITFPESVTSIGEEAFSYCDSLTAVTIPESVTSIGNYAFLMCSNLESITFPESVTSIGEGAFKNCTSLTAVTIPGSVTSIGIWAFGFCSSLTQVTIPQSVTYIANDAFDDSGLKTIYGYSGSCSENYAKEHGYNFVAICDFEDADSGVSMIATEAKALPENTKLAVSVVDTANDRITYDISLQSGGKEIRPNGSVTVKIPVPETMDGESVKIYRQEADDAYTDMHATYQYGYMVFTTDHFSIYALTTDDLDTPDVLLGDINGDKTVDAIDARWVLQASTNSRELTAEQQAAADVNADGVIDAIDARWILQASTGSRTL